MVGQDPRMEKMDGRGENCILLDYSWLGLGKAKIELLGLDVSAARITEEDIHLSAT